MEPTHERYGLSLSEWIERIPNELEVDDVGLWQIVPVGREGFGLTDGPLGDFVRRGILSLLKKGAVPVRAIGGSWVHQVQYGSDFKEIADRIVAEWQNSGRDPDHDGLWFSLVDE